MFDILNLALPFFGLMRIDDEAHGAPPDLPGGCRQLDDYSPGAQRRRQSPLLELWEGRRDD
jgi:hypothetical protein